jgi:hypothetical protein
LFIFLVTRIIKTTKDKKKKKRELLSKEESSSSIAPENIKETLWGDA